MIDSGKRNSGLNPAWYLGACFAFALLLMLLLSMLSAGTAHALIGVEPPTVDPSITIRKFSDQGDVIGGSTFSISPNPYTCEGSLEIADNDANDSSARQGMIRANEVCIEFDYAIQETVAPPGYLIDPQVYLLFVPDEKAALTLDSTSFPIAEDSDDDGVEDGSDHCPETPAGEPVDPNGCSDSQLDDDDDGVVNSDDRCPDTPEGESVDGSGCSEGQYDNDGDGVTNYDDKCPGTPAGEAVNAEGCGDSQLDDDKDGVYNDTDRCPGTPAGESVDQQGCSDGQLDEDQDGVLDSKDKCPGTPAGERVNKHGCSKSQRGDDDRCERDRDDSRKGKKGKRGKKCDDESDAEAEAEDDDKKDHRCKKDDDCKKHKRCKGHHDHGDWDKEDQRDHNHGKKCKRNGGNDD
ncbi:MAG: SpaA isopeptide-forming pilin-related protein [Dehalococcoidia bacterium]